MIQKHTTIQKHEILTKLERKFNADGIYFPLLERGRPSQTRLESKLGVGPRFIREDTNQDRVAVDCLVQVVFHYIEANLRVQLYLGLPTTESDHPILRTDPRPLRQDSRGNLVDPVLIMASPAGTPYAVVNPEYLKATLRWQFQASPGVLRGETDLSKLVEFQLTADETIPYVHWRYKITRAVRVMPDLGSKTLVTLPLTFSEGKISDSKQ